MHARLVAASDLMHPQIVPDHVSVGKRQWFWNLTRAQIRVQDKNGVVYPEAGVDPLGELQGGNIVIHDERKKQP